MGSYAAQLYKIIVGYGLDRHEQFAQLKAMLERRQISEGVARAYLHGIQPYVDEAIDFPNLLHRPPTAEQLYSQGHPESEFLTLVDSEQQLRYGIRLRKPRHTIIIGSTGSAKTCGGRRHIFNVHEYSQRNPDHRIFCTVFDRKGSDYGDLSLLLGPSWIHLSVHDGMRIDTGPPLGMGAETWIPILSTVFCARAGLISAWVAFAKVLRWIVAVMNPCPGDRLKWPDFRLILDVLRASPPEIWASKGEYLRSLLTPLEGIVEASGTLFETFGGLQIERDLASQGKSGVVIDMCNLSPPWLRLFVVDLIVARNLFGRQQRRHRVAHTEMLFVLDEADPDVSRDSEAAFPDKLSVLGSLLKTGREFGLAALVVLTSLGNTSRFVLANAQYHLAFGLSDEESNLEAKRTLMLPPGSEEMFPALSPGEAIFREAQGPWHHAMRVKVDEVPPCRIGTPKFDTHPFVPSKPLSEYPELKGALAKLIAEYRATKARQSRTPKSSITKKAQELLELACLLPYLPVIQLWKKIGTPPFGTQKKVRTQLKQKRLAKFDDRRIGRRTMLLMDPTEKGWKLLSKEAPPHQGRGGIAHRHLAHWLVWRGEKEGFRAALEWVVPSTNHPVDAAWLDGDHVRAFEVVVDETDNLISHLEACLIQSQAVETVTIVACQKSQLRDIERQVRSAASLQAVLDRISYEDAETFLVKELWP
jgi:hypothetical protein